MVTAVKMQNETLLIPKLIFLGLIWRSDRANLDLSDRKIIKKKFGLVTWCFHLSSECMRELEPNKAKLFFNSTTLYGYHNNSHLNTLTK